MLYSNQPKHCISSTNSLSLCKKAADGAIFKVASRKKKRHQLSGWGSRGQHGQLIVGIAACREHTGCLPIVRRRWAPLAVRLIV